jgi:acyl-CoA synthetase (AMP-forming)/AMP-acid ligase II
MAPVKLIDPTPAAYGHPLLIKHLLRTPLARASRQETSLGVGPGDTVGVMDWDSHRYLECCFAVPMMGAVLHTVNVRLPAEQVLYTINHAEDDVLLVNADFLPLLVHVHAWGLPCIATLLGMKQVYPGRYTPENVLNLMSREKVTFSHCVPTILHLLLDCPTASRTDLSHWKIIIGGSAVYKGLCQAARDKGINIFTGYGMSETCPMLTLSTLKPHMRSLSPEDELEIRRRAGIPLPLVDLKVIDPQGRACPTTQRAPGRSWPAPPGLPRDISGRLKPPQSSGAAGICTPGMSGSWTKKVI